MRAYKEQTIEEEAEQLVKRETAQAKEARERAVQKARHLRGRSRLLMVPSQMQLSTILPSAEAEPNRSSAVPLARFVPALERLSAASNMKMRRAMQWHTTLAT